MTEQISYKSILNFFFKPNRIKFWVGIFTLIIGLSVLQDYLYSQVRETGFYISESLLYNTIWLFMIPFTLLEFRILSYCKIKSKINLLLFLLLASGLLVLLHITLFTSFFVSVSSLVYSPSHRFVRIFNSSISSEFSSIFAIYYFSAPLLLQFYHEYIRVKGSSNQTYPEQINVKVGLKTVSIHTESIEVISTNKPYISITVNNKVYFDNRTMKDFENFQSRSIEQS